MNAATLPISDEQGQAFWRAAEAAQGVHDRYQFFVWLRLHLHRFIAHDLAMCRLAGAGSTAGACAGASTDDAVQLFYSVPLSRPLLEALPLGRSRFWRELHERWSARGGRAALLPLADCAPAPEVIALRAEGFTSLVVHGIGARARIQPEALFAFALREPAAEAVAAAAHLDVWLPALYCTAMRALAPAVAVVVEASARADEAPADGRPAASVLTGRELQILSAVRDAKRNAQIGELLGISPLTVKNHLRKIMRKLNAGNRAQAVAEAMARRLIA